MNIHFVCSGNIYRSRLAEAHLRSKQIPNISISSSGIKASTTRKGPISWYAQRILQRNRLTSFMSLSWTETRNQVLKDSDYIIFIGKDNYEFCKSKNYSIGKHVIWDLPDFDDVNFYGKKMDEKTEIKLINESEKTFSAIKEKVDQLIKKLRLSNNIQIS